MGKIGNFNTKFAKTPHTRIPNFCTGMTNLTLLLKFAPDHRVAMVTKIWKLCHKTVSIPTKFLHPAGGSQFSQCNGTIQMFNILPPNWKHWRQTHSLKSASDRSVLLV